VKENDSRREGERNESGECRAKIQRSGEKGTREIERESRLTAMERRCSTATSLEMIPSLASVEGIQEISRVELQNIF
jgi:hypothetical protein